MELGPKNIVRIIGIVVLIAIVAFLHYDRKKTLQCKLNGREYGSVLSEQVAFIKHQTTAMGATMRMCLDMFKSGAAQNAEAFYKAVAPIYDGIGEAKEAEGFVNELFSGNVLKLARDCQHIFNDFAFQSGLYDFMDAAADRADVVGVIEHPPAYDCAETGFARFTPEKYAMLETMSNNFENTRIKLFALLDKKYAARSAGAA